MERELSDEHSAGLVQRLKEATGDRSLRDIARITGHHPETVRRYLVTGKVSTEFAVRVSIAVGIRLEWLLTGQGPMSEAAYRLHALAQSGVQNLLSVLGEHLVLDRRKIERLEAKVAVLEAMLAAGGVSEAERAPRSSGLGRSSGRST